MIKNMRFNRRINNKIAGMEKKLESFKKLKYDFMKLWECKDDELRKFNHFEERHKSMLNDPVYKKLQKINSEYCGDKRNDYLLNLMWQIDSRKMKKETYEYLLNTSEKAIAKEEANYTGSII